MKIIRGTHAYVGFNVAGKARTLVFDDPGFEKDTAQSVARWIKAGYRMVRMPANEACAALRGGQ